MQRTCVRCREPFECPCEASASCPGLCWWCLFYDLCRILQRRPIELRGDVRRRAFSLQDPEKPELNSPLLAEGAGIELWSWLKARIPRGS